MEFSFDRSNSANLHNKSQSQSGPSAAPAQNGAVDDGVDTSTIANERLRKAIERNRACQAERNRSQPQASEKAEEQASLFDKAAEAETGNHQRVPPHRVRAHERAHGDSVSKNSGVVTRRSAARPDEADFTPVKRAPKKVSSQISYSTSSNRKKTKPLDPKLLGYLVKGSWGFCSIMVLRLFFAHGGVTDYYSHRSVYNDRLGELDRIKKENMQLVREIERMKTDTTFQKKLVRDNLGFIASDEFLVLFPKEKSIQ